MEFTALNKYDSIVEYYDPFISEFIFNKRTNKSLKKLNSKIIKKFDAVLILTEHSNVDYKLIKEGDVIEVLGEVEI